MSLGTILFIVIVMSGALALFLMVRTVIEYYSLRRDLQRIRNMERVSREKEVELLREIFNAII